MTLPSFLCIGAQKAGTSWVFSQFVKHPDIWMPPIKELHFFDHLYVEENRVWTTKHIRSGVLSGLTNHINKKGQPDWSYMKYLVDMAADQLFTEAWYSRCYDHPKAKEKICGDITPAYSTIPQEGIEYVNKLLPNVKIFYIIRDPVDRALSQLRMNVERRQKPPNETTLLEMCDEFGIDNRGDYMTYIPNWQKKIDKKNLLILPYGEIKSDGKSFVQQIEKFLGVSHFKGYDFAARVHATKKITIPESVIKKLSIRYEPQREFIAKMFGQEFLRKTR